MDITWQKQLRKVPIPFGALFWKGFLTAESDKVIKIIRCDLDLKNFR